MSLMTDIALKASIEDYTAARDKTLRLLKQGLKLCDMARACSEEHVRYGFPTDVMPRISYEAACTEIDRRWWRTCFRQTGLARLMDEQATKEFEQSLENETPPFTTDNIQTMALTMYQNADELFLRGVWNIFRTLDRSYRTNDRQRFALEVKSIVPYLFDTWFSVQGQFRLSYHKRAWVNDLHRCVCVLTDQPYQEYSLEADIHAQMMETNTFENDLIKLRGFKNGNGHLWILDEQLRNKINRCIADYCGPAIADGRRKAG